MYRITRFLLLPSVLLLGAWLWGLFREEAYTPKPPGYPRIELPGHEYVLLEGSFPYRFEVSKHAVITPNNTSEADTYWIDIRYPTFEAEIKLTYKPVKNNPQLLREYCNDAHKLTAKHQIKASAIEEKTFTTRQGHIALLADLKGEVPSQVQFYTTDGTRHFLRGALYFNTATQNNYLAPVIAFIRKDIIHLIQTLTWQEHGTY